ncbi:MAG: T9SS type A sorting domain-containing protein [Chitinophagaceae bacterium]|nr:T9SS type A sorting domain-containing protein [Chitinophagaceae bacterium]
MSQSLNAQIVPQLRWPKSPNGKIVCFTDEMERYRYALQGLTENRKVFELWMSKQQNQLNADNDLARNTPIVYSIPVIFHIIHNGEANGTGRNIAKAFIDSQIIQINDDFRRIANTSGYNNHASGADVEIQFVAATLNPANAVLGEPGIERINRNARGWTAPPHMDTYMQSTIKPNSFWNPDKYLNIWVCDLTDASGLVLGYAQQPIAPGNIGQDEDTASIASTDGIVLHYSIVGSSNKKPAGVYPYDEGRILTHELGHFFGLRHVWGEGNCDLDDFVFDTPRQDGVSFGCATTNNTCNDTNYGSPYDSADMVKNYMQYSDNACVNIFTQGQKNRMRAVMGENGAGSPRRESLRFSDRAQLKPKISFVSTDTTIIERTQCNMPWGFVIPVRISRPPTGTTYASVNITGNTNGQDFTLSPDSVSFSPTDTADKYFAVTMNPDAVMEGHERAFINLAVNDTNSTAAPDGYELTILNDDNIPMMGKRINGNLFAEDFETPSAGWQRYDYIKGNNRWLIGGTNGDVNNGKSAYISKDSSSLAYEAGSRSHTLLFHSIEATNWDSLNLSFYYKCKGQTTSGVKNDFGKLMYSIDSLNFFQVNGTEDLTDSSNASYYSTRLPSFLWNRKFYIGFYWQNDTATANNPPFAIDDILISGKTYIPASIHTSVDTAIGFSDKPLGPMETVDFYDRMSGNILATIQNLSGHNYGCVDVAIDRAGTGAQFVNNDPGTNPQNKLFDRTYKIIPQYNNTTGNYKVTFYLTQAEVAGWMLNSGNPLSNLYIIKDTGHISNTDYSGPYEQRLALRTSYLGGADYAVSSVFMTGFSGFGFGHITIGTLPVNLVSFRAIKKDNSTLLAWTVENESNIQRYVIQRSTDGSGFTDLSTVPATMAGGRKEYTQPDEFPLSGWNYYRLAIYDKDNHLKYSQIEKVFFGKGIEFTVSPNPFMDKIVLNSSGSVTEGLQVQLSDLSGRIISKNNYTTVSPGQPLILETPGLSRGIYHLKIITKGETWRYKILKQ